MRRLLFTHLWVPVVGAALLVTSCETSEQKRAAVAPPMRAQAPTIQQQTTPPSQQPRIEEKLTPKADPVEQAIAAAEKEYQAGRANYSAGHLEGAKENFDHAFDSLLQAPFDIRHDDRLQQEFDKIVEGVHQLELLALKEGDGFTEQRSEPAPIDEANEVTFPVDPNIKAKAEAELKTTQSDLPLTLNDAVASYINYFSNTRGGRGFLEHGYIRAGRYREMILKTLKDEGVPQDLIYLAQAESGFHPLALSRAGARGMWQFMAGRGLQYGLKRSWWVDERQDPVKATRAAARHLKDLYNQFGDWYLVMAAYNSGPGTVQHAVERTGYADYWELYHRGVLPGETRNYVPIILAITIMSKNPAQYGLERLRAEAPLPHDTITINYPVDLRLAAECADTSVAMLQELNPSLLRLTTPKDQEFQLRLPVGAANKFETAIAAIPRDKRVLWRYHRVASGDTLAGIARKYHTTSASIIEVNKLEGDELRHDARLIIPITPGRQTEGLAFSKHATKYKVRKGDTVLSIADDFNVPAERVRKWNRLKGNTLTAGRVLTIHRPVATAGAGPEPIAGRRASRGGDGEDEPSARHSKGKQAASKSKRGRLAAEDEEEPTPAKHGKSQAASKTKRGKQVDEDEEPVAGRRGKKVPEVASKAKKGVKSKPQQVVHKVKKGETLTSIASEYNVSVNDLRKNNRKLASNIKPGDVVVIKRGE